MLQLSCTNFDGGHVRVMSSDHPVRESGVIRIGFGGRDLQVALARIDVVRQQYVANAFVQVPLVLFAGRSQSDRNRAQHLVEQLARALVEAQMCSARAGGRRGRYTSGTSFRLARYSSARIPMHHVCFSQGLSWLF